MPNCVVIIFGHAVIQRNYDHMQKQERTNAILITDYVVAIVNVANLVILSLDLVIFDIFQKPSNKINFLDKPYLDSETLPPIYIYIYIDQWIRHYDVI